MLKRILSIAICQAFLIGFLPGQLQNTRISATPSTDSVSSETRDDIPNLASRLTAIERTLEQRRKLENIPGLALVIVASDKVIYVKGFGFRDIEHNLPVTPETLFEIGSTSKAFTAMAAVISVDDGKLSLDDPPKKYLTYFKLRDPETDAAVTIRDLLSHRTGLKAHDDDLWLNDEKLSREAVIKAIMMSKPTAKLREKFQYNNVMFTAAGECIARAQQSTWEDVIRTRILQPLGMNASVPVLRELRDTSNLSLGYKIGKTPKPVRRRDFSNVAPAGGIISNAVDMAQWMKLMIGGGVIEGRRLVSEKGFSELVSKQMSVRENVDYGLGWGIVRWHERKFVTHTGGTEGFSSHVELQPDQKLGFVFLCNVPEAQLVKEIRGIIWGELLDIH